MEEQLEAAILQNFWLVQADKHGQHLLASLPTIAGANPHLNQVIVYTLLYTLRLKRLHI